MSQRVRTFRGRHRRAAVFLLGCLGGLLAARPSLAAEPKSGSKDKGRGAAGQCVAVTGGFLQHDEDRGWKVIKSRDAVASGALLLALPGSRAEIAGNDGSAHLILAGNLPELSLIPLLESAVVLRRPGKNCDVDFTLDRGRVIVANKSKKGPVKACVHIQGQTWDLVLKRPGAEVSIEHVARWVERPSSVEKPKKTDRPDVSVFLVALKGEISVETDGSEVLLGAPPGPAFLSWKRGQGVSGPMRLKELPPWARPDAYKSTAAQAALARVEKVGKWLEKSTVSAGLTEALESKDSHTRILAVYCLGAVDDLAALVAALESAKQRDVRLAAIDELRHWLGRDADNMPTLFQTLREKTYSPAQARIAISLLQPFSRRQLARPETYALLIDYLTSSRLAIRELAYWHLIRLAPEEGRKITYDPAADESTLKQAHARWKKELPDGQLPRKPKPVKRN